MTAWAHLHACKTKQEHDTQIGSRSVGYKQCTVQSLQI